MSAGLRGEARIGGGVLVRAKRYVVAASAVALVVSGAIVSATPAAAASCPTVLPDGTLLVAGWTGYVGCDLDGADLDGLTLTGNLTGSSLVGASLRGAVLRNVILTGSDLTDADLTDADLTGATGSSLVLDGAVFDGAQLARATLSAASADGTHLASARLAGASVQVLSGTPVLPAAPAAWVLTSTMLVGPGANLYNVTLDQPQVHGISLAGTDLRYAQILGGSFTGSDLAGADLRGAYLSGTDLTAATGYADAWWDGAGRYDITCPDGVKIVKHNAYDCLAGTDSVAPVVVVGGSTGVWTLDGNYSWPLSFTETGSGLDIIRWSIRSTPSGRTSWTPWKTTDWEGATKTTRMPSYPQQWSGTRTCVKAQVRDVAGNLSAWTAERCSEVPYEETDAFSSWSGFQRMYVNVGPWSGSGYQLTRTRGSEMGLGKYVTAKHIGVVATTCPTCGSVAIFLGSKKVASLSLARSTTTMRKLVLTTLPAQMSGRLLLVVTSSNGKTVRLDGVAVSTS